MTEREFALTNSMILLYGAPKTGKTTLACGSGKALLLHTPGCGHTVATAYKLPVETWADFTSAVKSLRALKKKEGKLPYTAVVVDLISDVQDMLGREIIAKHNKDKRASVVDLSEIDGAWTMLRRQFMHGMDLLADLGVTVVLVAHEKMRDFSEGVMKRSKWTNNLTGSARVDVPGRCDLIGRLAISKGERLLLVNPSEKSEAGNRYGFQEPYIKAEWAELEKLAKGGGE